jgi:TrmH family RNA methyltransferase
MLGKNKIKLINSLKQKKFRIETGQFILEGDKLVSELLEEKAHTLNMIVATSDWLHQNRNRLHEGIFEIIEAGESEFRKITSFENPTGVLAVMPIPVFLQDNNDLAGQLSISLDTIQDPGNLGTIIRTADWFGIRHIYCSTGCADWLNPKVVQSSMGAILRVSVHYLDLKVLLEQLYQKNNYPVYGSLLEGRSLFETDLSDCGMILFGNESRGIHPDLLRYISMPLTIPSFSAQGGHVESLNVSTAMAIFCSEFFRRRTR